MAVKLRATVRENGQTGACSSVLHGHCLACTVFNHMERSCPEIPCDVIFYTEEWEVIYIVTHRKILPNLNEMVRTVTSFGGFLDRKGDGGSGVQTL